jgi:hypothetical protein
MLAKKQFFDGNEKPIFMVWERRYFKWKIHIFNY